PEPPLQLSADNMTGSHGPEGNEVSLTGNLRVTRGRSVLTAETGRYMQTARMLFLDGRVKMVDSSTTVTCDHATYSEDTDILQLFGHVVVVDRKATLRAPSGTYDRRRGVADLFGGVEATDRNQRLLCDRAVYVRDSLILRARGNVRGFDDENRVELEGQSVDYDRQSFWAVATGDPVLRVRDDEGRASEIRARLLRVNSETRYAEARDSVRVTRDSLQARADLGIFDDRAGRGWLTGSPRAWDPETEVSGDTLELWSHERRLERMVVRRGATVEYKGTRPGAAGETSRLTGDRVDAFVTRNALDSLVAVGNARNAYTAAPKAGKTAERNVASGDTITVFFKDRKIDLARVTGGATGEYAAPVEIGDTLSAARELIRYDAKRIEFEVPNSRIVLDEGAHLTYRDLELKSKRVVYDVEKQSLVASGSPELLDRGDKVDGHLMTYDLGTRVGTIYGAETAYERGLYRGEAIRKVSEDQLDVNRGEYTTCSLDHPHYRFSARWMKIYLKDKLVAKPVVFFVKNVPVLALPFWVFPIKPGRHSGFLFPQFEFGLNNQAGQFIRNAGYYWAPNDYLDFTGSGDYYQAEPSWVLRGEGVYKKLYVMDGSVRGTFARNERLRSDDYDVGAQHYQELSPRTRVTGQASFVSSRDYSSSNLFGRTLEQRLNRFLTSSLALSHNADWASFSAVLDRRQDLDAETNIRDPDGSGPLEGPAVGTRASSFNVQSTLPNLSVGFPTRTLGSLGFLRGSGWEKRLATLYLSYDARFVDSRSRRGYVERKDTTVVDGTPRAINVIAEERSSRRAFGSSVSMSDSRRPFGWLNLSPRLDSQFAIFDFDEAGNKVVPASSWSAGLSTSSTFYGLFRPAWGRVTGLRHVVFPNASFSYSPEIGGHKFRDANGVERNRFTSVGGIGVSSFKQAFMSFGVDQRLQVKYRQGDKVQ
ncbi:MAG: putative LPS assembly protein LptD, partial [Candidatus Eisenbacteria bacterium]